MAHKLVTLHFKSIADGPNGYQFSDVPELDKYLKDGFEIRDIHIATNNASQGTLANYLVVVKLISSKDLNQHAQGIYS